MEKEKTVHAGHRQRLKSTLKENGIEALTDVQILEFLLFYGNRQGDTNVAAHNLIDAFGSLDAVFDADIEDLTRVNGVSENIAYLIKFVPQISRAYHSRRAQNNVKQISGTSAAAEYLISQFKNYDHELFAALYLDSRNFVKKFEIIGEGISGAVDISIHKIVRFAMKYNANSVIIAHNHPGGDCRPSSADITATRKVSEALTPLDLRLLDHIIVTQNAYYSFADEKIPF